MITAATTVAVGFGFSSCDIDLLPLNEVNHIKAVKEEWAEYVTTTTTTGAKTSNPPANNGGKTGKTKEEIMAIRDPAVRQAEIAKNPEAFGLKFD